jgi:hypothetical protein
VETLDSQGSSCVSRARMCIVLQWQVKCCVRHENMRFVSMFGALMQANHSAEKLFASIGCDPTGQKGLFLSPLLLVAKMLHSPEGRQCLTGLDSNTQMSVVRSCAAVAQALKHPTAAPPASEALELVFALLDDMMASGGPPVQYHAIVLRRLVECMRVQQQCTGLAPSWILLFEELLYRICVNDGARPSRTPPCSSQHAELGVCACHSGGGTRSGL